MPEVLVLSTRRELQPTRLTLTRKLRFRQVSSWRATWSAVKQIIVHRWHINLADK